MGRYHWQNGFYNYETYRIITRNKETTFVSCDFCHEQIETSLFIEHMYDQKSLIYCIYAKKKIYYVDFDFCVFCSKKILVVDYLMHSISCPVRKMTDKLDRFQTYVEISLYGFGMFNNEKYNSIERKVIDWSDDFHLKFAKNFYKLIKYMKENQTLPPYQLMAGSLPSFVQHHFVNLCDQIFIEKPFIIPEIREYILREMGDLFWLDPIEVRDWKTGDEELPLNLREDGFYRNILTIYASDNNRIRIDTTGHADN